MPETPFDSVESAQHYVSLLVEAVNEARTDIASDIEAAIAAKGDRQLVALRLVDHKLTQLNGHLHGVSRILNDLRMLRRLLLAKTDDDSG